MNPLQGALAFLLGLTLAWAVYQARAQQPANPPFVTAPWSALNPDLAGIVSEDRSAAAALVTFSGPMPAPTSDFVLRVASAQTGQIDFHGVVHEDSTFASIALDLCNQINANKEMKRGNVACQINFPGSSTFFGVTHYNDNYMIATGLTGAPIMQVVNNGAPMSWDAGPTLFLNRSPGFGAIPPPNSNCGQIFFAAPTTATPGMASAQYVTLGCTVISADVNNVQGMLSIYVGKTINGAPLLDEIVQIRPDGLYVRGRKVITE